MPWAATTLDIVPMPSGEITIVVADVAGKGLASALVGTSFRSAFRAMVNAAIPLVEIATRMNLLHFNEGEESQRRYVTAIFVQLDPATDTHPGCKCRPQSGISLSPGKTAAASKKNQRPLGHAGRNVTSFFDISDGEIFVPEGSETATLH